MLVPCAYWSWLLLWRPSVAAEYAPMAAGQPELFAELAKQDQTRITVERFSQPDNPASVEYQSVALGRMLDATSLSSVRLASSDGDKVFHLGSFVYQPGGFRWIGKLEKVSGEPAEIVPDSRSTC